MAGAGRHPDPALKFALSDRFRQFDPLQLVRLWLRRGGAMLPERAAHTRVHFLADLGAAFPGRPISAINFKPSSGNTEDADTKDSASDEILCISTADFCVGSALGPLPEPFLDWVRQQAGDNRNAMRDFLDLFNNRLNWLRYAMRAAFEPGLSNQLRPERTELAQQVAALMGLAERSVVHRLHIPQRSWLGIGGLLGGARRSAASLNHVLAAHLGCPVRLEQMVGSWYEIDTRDQHRLGARRLGQDTLLGRRVWDTQRRVRLHVGPLRFEQAQALLPPLHPHAARSEGEGQPSLHTAFTALLHLMLDRRHDAEIAITIDPGTVPASSTVAWPAKDPAKPGLRLGQTAWLQGEPPAEKPRVLNFLVLAHERAVPA